MPYECPCDPCECGPACTCGCGPECTCGEGCACQTTVDAAPAA
jgi:hypothetical protein